MCLDFSFFLSLPYFLLFPRLFGFGMVDCLYFSRWGLNFLLDGNEWSSSVSNGTKSLVRSPFTGPLYLICKFEANPSYCWSVLMILFRLSLLLSCILYRMEFSFGRKKKVVSFGFGFSVSRVNGWLWVENGAPGYALYLQYIRICLKSKIVSSIRTTLTSI